MSGPYIRIEGVSKRFGDLAAVDNVSLDIERGEIFCLLGASGCGKTTLLRMLAGFEQTSGGRILIDGVDMAAVPPYHRPVNMMFQSYALFPHMSVEQNVAFGLKQEGIAREEIARRVADMLAIVKLRGFERRKPHQLSGGQRQRVALARALIKQPKVLLLDEPLGALDKKLREHTQFELLNIQHQLGVTFVVVTHDQEEAMTLASRIGVMNHGRIVQVGMPRDIYEFPRTRFVAEFIGSVNTFEGRVSAQDSGRLVVESGELAVPLYIGQPVQAAHGAVVWTAVRPEKMRLSRERPASAYNHAHGVVTDVAYLGDTSTYLIQLASGKTLRTTEPNAERDAAGRLARNEPVWVSWNESSCVVVTE
jgi:putrescine transport system ATP-binding protein